MSVIDFRKSKKPPAAEAALAVQEPPHPNMEIGNYQPENASQQLDGEFSQKDAKLPFLTCVSQSSDCVAEHPEWIGRLLLDKQFCLGVAVNVVVTKVAKHYEGSVVFGSGVIPNRWKKIADAEAWQNKEGGEFLEVGVLDLLVEVPKDSPSALSDQALLSVDGIDYVGARLTSRKKAFKNTVGILIRDLNAWLRGKFINGKYTIECEKLSWQGKTWFSPKLKAAGPTSEALRKAIAIQFGL